MTDIGTLAWESRALVALAAVIGAVLLGQTVLVLWAARRLDELSHIRERISRLADGLALLTDTTEAGLATMARELQQVAGRTPARSTTRGAVSRRVVAAARKGESLAAIAGREALSESEVRLHVQLADARRRQRSTDAGAGA